MKQKKQRTIAIFALSMALVATTVAYAVLQTSLNVSGSVTRKGGSWNVYIDAPKNVVEYGDAELNVTKPSGTNLNFTATLKKPGDYFSFDFDLVNAGTLDAAGYLSESYPVVSSDNLYVFDTAGTDITCTLKYNGNLINWWDTYVNGLLDLDAPSSSGNPTRKTLNIKCSYDNVSSISSEDKTLNFSLLFPYRQK